MIQVGDRVMHPSCPDEMEVVAIRSSRYMQDVAQAKFPDGSFHLYYLNELTLVTPSLEEQRTKIVNDLISYGLINSGCAEELLPGSYGNDSCDHMYVNVGFTHLVMACKYCGEDQ